MNLSIRAYGRHRGVSDTAVRKAIKAGRITREPDGTIDPVRADAQWRENTAVRAAPAPESGRSLSAVELALCQALNNSVIGATALMIANGVPGATALRAFDYVVVAVFTVLEEQLGREARILLQGNLQLLNDDAEGRPLLIERAEAVALTLAGDLSDGTSPAT